MSEIVWSDPPSKGGRGSSLAWVWEALMASPGEWAEWPRGALSARVSADRATERYADGRFECTTRTIDGERKAWVRWVPEDAA